MSFQIPKRKNVKPSSVPCSINWIDPSKVVEQMIEDLPQELIPLVKTEFQNLDVFNQQKSMGDRKRISDLESEIIRIQEEILTYQRSLRIQEENLTRMKRKYLENDARTHNKLVTELEDCFKTGRNFVMTFDCECMDRHNKKDHKYIYMCPPVKALFQQLETQNYTPTHTGQICLSPYAIEHNISCDLDF
jgi:hypothetical protein